jgi:hypothetical protein
VLLNTTAPGASTPSFAAQQVFGSRGGLPYFVAVADMNGDGSEDLVSANGGFKTVSVLLNTRFRRATQFGDPANGIIVPRVHLRRRVSRTSHP